MSGIADVHFGEPSDNWPVEQRVQVHFHNFADLPQQKGTLLKTSKFTCAGHEWFLQLCPRGDRNAEDGMISVFLGTDLASKIVVDFDIHVKKKTGNNFRSCSATKREFPGPNNAWGVRNYASRGKILDASNNILNDGTLTFEVRIRPHEDYICRDANVLPKSSVADNLFKLCLDEGSADVAFVVKGRVFHAHKLILKSTVPELLVLAELFDAENPFPIEDVEPDIFETMLEYVYGKDIGAFYWKDHAKQVLDAAVKYGFTELKSFAEAWHVKNLQKNFTKDNVVDELLYADGKSCPLLKKSVMDFINEHGVEVIKSASYEKLVKSHQLCVEVMEAGFASNNNRKRDE